MSYSSTLFVIAAPSGTGKTTLVKALVESMANITVSVSHTTRPIRPGEQDGINYHFISPTEFAKLVTDDVFLEHALVHGNHYGTSRAWVESQLKKGMDVILEIDWQGAQQIRKVFPDAASIFILPPSPAALEMRLKQRRQDHQKTIAQRLAAASSEIAHCAEFDYLVVNDVFSDALQDLRAIIQAQRLKQPRQALLQASILAKWL
ncbi:MAG: guanylate kinase [Gammaproteobacteria bacterium]